MDRVGQQLGNYLLTRLLGHGGFAEVYLGQHIHLGTQAAIKVLHGRMSAQDLQDFTNEARIIAGLKHPQILRVLDFGIEGTTPFLVMDYAPKGTLRDRHVAGSSLPVSIILPYVKQVAAALQYAHDQKLVHRDIKPENMLVDANDTILLSDFGIATVAHKTQSLSTQEAIGTVTYMSPEQIKGKARPASDQYSLGVVVYGWLCGSLPFDGSTSIEIAMHHLTDPPPPLQSKISTISPAVEQVVLRALSKDPQQRFPTVKIFADVLAQASQRGRSTTVGARNTPGVSSLPPTVLAPTPPSLSPRTVNTPQYPKTANPPPLFSPMYPPPPPVDRPFDRPSPQIRPARIPQKSRYLTSRTALLVLLISIAIIGAFLFLLLPTFSSTASPDTTTHSNANSAPLSIPETWIGTYNQPGYPVVNVELDVLSGSSSASGGQTFAGVWKAPYGTVSVAGQTVLFSSLPGPVQLDLQTTYGARVAIRTDTKIVTWRGQGNATGTLVPNAYYYSIRDGNSLIGSGYANIGDKESPFSITLQGGSSSLGT